MGILYFTKYNSRWTNVLLNGIDVKRHEVKRPFRTKKAIVKADEVICRKCDKL